MADDVGSDQVLHFAIPDKHCRGWAVRLDDVIDEILSTRDYPPPIRGLLAEALCITALLGSLLKDERGQLTLQAQPDGAPIKLLACDFKDGAIRGYVDYSVETLVELGAEPSLLALFGKGYLAVTFDPPPPSRRYQGIVPLEGESLADAVAYYFRQSEQIPSFLHVAVADDGAVCRAAGLLVQHLPEGEEGRERLHVRLDHPEWEHIEILAATVTEAELFDEALPLEGLIWRLFSESDEVRAFGGQPLGKGCRCDENHIRGVLARFPAEDRRDMADDDGTIAIDCAFCNLKFHISAASLEN